MPTFPITTTRPSYWCEIHAQDRFANIFYQGDTVTLPIVNPFVPGTYTDPIGTNTGPSKTPKNFTGNYYVRDYYGNMVASGTLTAQNTISLGSSLPCGWYKVFLTQSTNDATYGLAGGSGTFLVTPADSRFLSMAGLQLVSPRRNQIDGSHYGRAFAMHGPKRYIINDAINYNTGSPGDLGNIISCITNEMGLWLDPARADATRERRTFITFVANATATQPGRDGVTAVVQSLCNTFGADKFWFEGPANEPSGSGASIAANQQIFYTTVKAANASAMVIGPCPVSVNHSSRANNAACMAAMAAMSPVPVDGMSMHFYNSINGDLTMGRQCLTDWSTDLATNGLGALPRFQTEQSFKTTENGTYMVRFGARWDLQMLLLMDQFAIPKEHFYLWYDASSGFWVVPHFWQMNDMTMLPPIAMLRTLSAELWGKTFAAALDFGSPGNDMMLGNRYHDATTGNDVIALQAAGSTDSTVEFAVSGGIPTFTLVDCFGNTSTLTPANGQISVPTKLEPVYLRVPAGATATVIPKWTAAKLVRNLTKGASVTTSGSSANRPNAVRVINGVQDNPYYYNVGLSSRTDARAPYVDDTNSYPAWLAITWQLQQRIDRVVVFATPPWQGMGTLLDFDVQTWNGSSWDTQATISEPVTESTVDDPTAIVFPFVDYSDQGGCQHASFFSDRWIFDVPFGSLVTTTAIRIYIRNATYGMPPTLNCWTDQAGDKGTLFGNNFTIREIQVYDSDLATPRYVLGP